jgi:hypothetical protein
MGHNRTHAPQHRLYSITSPARPSSVRGKVRPSAFAVLRLITLCTFVNCITGKSASWRRAEKAQRGLLPCDRGLPLREGKLDLAAHTLCREY